MAKSVLKPSSTNKNHGTGTETNPGLQIRQALQKVESLRLQRQEHPSLLAGVAWIKQFQLTRFQACYADLLASSVYSSTAQFFVMRLYGDATPETRDAQFARIAPSIAKIFPEAVVQTAVDVAQLHALTEQLDQDMAKAALQRSNQPLTVHDHSAQACDLYLSAWGQIACTHLREEQLSRVLALGHRMGELVQVKGLALALRMMRGPAQLAKLGALQNWLEEGFSTFAALHRHPNASEQFLKLVAERENQFIAELSAPLPLRSKSKTLSDLLDRHP